MANLFETLSRSFKSGVQEVKVVLFMTGSAKSYPIIQFTKVCMAFICPVNFVLVKLCFSAMFTNVWPPFMSMNPYMKSFIPYFFFFPSSIIISLIKLIKAFYSTKLLPIITWPNCKVGTTFKTNFKSFSSFPMICFFSCRLIFRATRKRTKFSIAFFERNKKLFLTLLTISLNHIKQNRPARFRRTERVNNIVTWTPESSNVSLSSC